MFDSEEHWNVEYSRGIQASQKRVWQILSETHAWPVWNAGVAAVEMEGAFASGTAFTMVMPDGGRIRSRLIEVHPDSGFTDETGLGNLIVTVEHRMVALSDECTRVTYALTARGEGAELTGQAVSADFAEVLAGLARIAESPHES